MESELMEKWGGDRHLLLLLNRSCGERGEGRVPTSSCFFSGIDFFGLPFLLTAIDILGALCLFVVCNFLWKQW